MWNSPTHARRPSRLSRAPLLCRCRSHAIFRTRKFYIQVFQSHHIKHPVQSPSSSSEPSFPVCGAATRMMKSFHLWGHTTFLWALHRRSLSCEQSPSSTRLSTLILFICNSVRVLLLSIVSRSFFDSAVYLNLFICNSFCLYCCLLFLVYSCNTIPPALSNQQKISVTCVWQSQIKVMNQNNHSTQVKKNKVLKQQKKQLRISRIYKISQYFLIVAKCI